MKVNKRFIENILIFFTIFSIVVLNLSSTSNVLYTSTFIYLITLFYFLIKQNFKIRINKLAKIYLVFTVFSSLSIFWALNKSFTITLFPRLINAFLVLNIFLLYFQTEKNIKKGLKYFFVATIILISYNLMNFGFSRRFDFGGPNTIGTLMFFSIMFVFYLVLIKQFKYLYLIPIFLFVLIATASQKAILTSIIVLIVFFILSFWFKNLIKSIKYISLAVVIVIIGFFIIKKIPNFEYAFYRTNATIQSIFTGTAVEGAPGMGEGSFRNYLRTTGWQYFLESPIIGFGLNNYRSKFGTDTGQYTYSHHTPTELLVGTGLIGFVLYYSFFLIAVYQSYKNIRKFKSPASFYFFSVYVGIFVISLFQQMYFDLFTMLIIALAYHYPKNTDEIQ